MADLEEKDVQVESTCDCESEVAVDEQPAAEASCEPGVDDAGDVQATRAAEFGEDVKELAKELGEAGALFAQKAGDAVKAFAEKSTSEEAQTAARDAVNGAVTGIATAFSGLAELAGGALQGLAAVGASVLGAGAAALDDIANRDREVPAIPAEGISVAPEQVEAVIETVEETLGEAAEQVEGVAGEIVDGLRQAVTEAREAVGQMTQEQSPVDAPAVEDPVAVEENNADVSD